MWYTREGEKHLCEINELIFIEGEKYMRSSALYKFWVENDILMRKQERTFEY